MLYKILLSNLGYARGISGSLGHHVRYAHRHIYCSPQVQEEVLSQFAGIIEKHDPDLCCILEIDKGCMHTANVNQLERLINEHYSFFDIENKYGKTSWLRNFSLTQSKSTAFVSKQNIPFQKLYFSRGAKRLIYKVQLPHEVSLFFTHFSLNRSIRRLQLEEVRHLVMQETGEVILLGDFNILTGFAELKPLLDGTGLHLLNSEDTPTFQFHRRKLALDLCLCSKKIAERTDIEVIPQPYSDHAALLVKVNP